MDNKRITSLSFLIIALSIAFYIFYFLPHKENVKLEAQEQAENEKEKNSTKCLESAHDNYVAEGNKECENRGYTMEQYENLECLLPRDVLDKLEKRQSDAQKFCLERYK